MINKQNMRLIHVKKMRLIFILDNCEEKKYHGINICR